MRKRAHCKTCARGPLEIRARGLCYPCWKKERLRTGPLKSWEPSTAAPCRHCGKGPGCRPRGLCSGCYATVRDLYPSKNLAAGAGEPTQEEVDALVAYWSRPENLPAWWWNDCREMASREPVMLWRKRL